MNAIVRVRAQLQMNCRSEFSKSHWTRVHNTCFWESQRWSSEYKMYIHWTCASSTLHSWWQCCRAPPWAGWGILSSFIANFRNQYSCFVLSLSVCPSVCPSVHFSVRLLFCIVLWLLFCFWSEISFSIYLAVACFILGFFVGFFLEMLTHCEQWFIFFAMLWRHIINECVTPFLFPFCFVMEFCVPVQWRAFCAYRHVFAHMMLIWMTRHIPTNLYPFTCACPFM